MARTKTVFDSDQVAHIWAQSPTAIAEHGADIRTATGNLFTRDVYTLATDKRAARNESAIWSYGSHYCLARWTRTRTGAAAVLFNRHGWSNTTRKHRGSVRYALREHVEPAFLFECDKPQASGPREHRENLADYRAEYEAAIVSAGRPRIREATRAAELARAERILSEANRYALAFGLGRYKLRAMDTAAISARVAREERAAAKQRDEQRKAAELRNAEQIAEFLAVLPDWRNGSRDTYSMPARHLAPVALRIVADNVETTLGAEFPADDARALWPLILATRSAGRDFVPGGLRAHTLGRFPLTRITAGGDVVAGCHTVPFGECAHIARGLGLIPASEGTQGNGF